MRIQRHTLEDAPEGSRTALQSLALPNGRVFNIFGHMAASPAVLQGFLALKATVEENAELDRRTQEAIALAVGNENACDYCQAAHSLTAQGSGLSKEEILAIRSGDLDGDPKLNSLLVLARAAAANVGVVDQALWDAALQAGWSQRQLAELHAHIAVNLFTNHFNHWAQTELDFPAAPAIG